MTFDVSRPTLSAAPLAVVDGLAAIYDLAVSPLTFDILPFLVAAEIARRDAGATHIHFILIPPGEGGQYGQLGALSQDNLDWRIRQIIVPATALMPSVKAVSVVENRAAAGALLGNFQGPRYPEYHAPEHPIAGFSVAEVEAAAFQGDPIPTLVASPQARTFVARWLDIFSGGRKPVSVTLREADNASGKNSNIDAWSSFLAELDTSVYFPFIIRDTDRVFEPVPPVLAEVAQFPLAAVNIELRAAVYELSYLNLVGSSGPTLLCLFDARARCLIFNLGVPAWQDTSPDSFRKNYGIEPGQQLRHATPFQRLVWGPDDTATISRHFDLMTRFIEKGGAALIDDDERDLISFNHDSPSVVADRLFTGRQWGPAKTLYRYLLRSQPEHPEWIYRLGVAETWSGGPRQGITLLQRASDLGLSSVELYLARCEALIFLGQTDQALANARYALEIDPDNFDAALRLGLMYETHNRFEDARLWLERAISLRPDSREARIYLETVRSRGSLGAGAR